MHATCLIIIHDAGMRPGPFSTSFSFKIEANLNNFSIFMVKHDIKLRFESGTNCEIDEILYIYKSCLLHH